MIMTYGIVTISCVCCRPEEFLEHGARASGATAQQSSGTSCAKEEARTPDSDSDSELFVNTNRAPTQTESDHSTASDSS